MSRRYVDAIAELRGFAQSHAAMKAGRGNTEDLLAFADWLETVDRLERAQRSVTQLPGLASSALVKAHARDLVAGIARRLAELRANPPR